METLFLYPFERAASWRDDPRNTPTGDPDLQRGRKVWATLNVLLERYALPQPRSISPAYRAANL